MNNVHVNLKIHQKYIRQTAMSTGKWEKLFLLLKNFHFQHFQPLFRGASFEVGWGAVASKEKEKKKEKETR